MLTEIRIRGLGVIVDAEIELSPGLTVVTGETGAGKTMVVTSIGLLSGARADPALVRAGERAAVVEGSLLLDAAHPAVVRAADAGAELDDGALLLARSIAAEGRSRAFAGGRSVPAAVLAELADELIAVHGQSDQQLLRHPARQRAALDRYAGDAVAKPLTDYQATYDAHAAATAELHALTTTSRERAQEADLLAYGLGEIDEADPQPREDVDVATELTRLEHADRLRAAAESAHEALVADGDLGGLRAAADAVADARSALERVAEHDTALGELATRVSGLSYEITDVAAELSSYATGLDDDPARLAYLQERRALLAGLIRKYGAPDGTADDVLAWAATARDRVASIGGDDERIDALTERCAELRTRLGELAAAVSAARTEAAERFGAAVTAELTGLAMPDAVVRLDVSHELAADGLPIDGETVAFTREGIDTVALLLRPHAGAPELPVQRGASGGELSRVMLAIEVVFAGADPVPTFVFDEVDAGVGGRAAAEVGARLARLAETAQVIVVTHLPQVAAYADLHVAIRKSAAGAVTRSDVAILRGSDRERELARMLAGLEESDLAQAHAEELLARAAADKRVRN